MLHRLKPVTPVPPKRSNSQPPTTPPTTPRMMSRKKPSPRLFTILLAMNPAIRPRIIHPMIDISLPPSWLWFHGLGSAEPALRSTGSGCVLRPSNLPAFVAAGKLENITFGSLRTIIRCLQQASFLTVCRAWNGRLHQEQDRSDNG